MKVAILSPVVSDSGQLYGAQRHILGMTQAFRRAADATLIQVPVSETRWESILQAYLDCYDLDVSGYDLVVSTKAPTYLAQHPNHICWLLHQIRVFYDRFEDEYGSLPAAAQVERRRQRGVIHRLDNLAFPRLRKIFTNGRETARRLKLYNSFDAETLYPPVFAQGHYCGAQEYFLLPGRLHPWKRVDLAIRAMRHFEHDIPLLIAGTGEDEERLRELAGNDPRIRFLGFVGDTEMLKLYADALAVLFIPKDEDFGYITIEAMLSHKPVIVCEDSGEPTSLVQNGHSGLIAHPTASEVAGAMSVLASNRELAREMGERAYESAPSQSWDEAVRRILDAGTPLRTSWDIPGSSASQHNVIPLLVADNQVLDPPVGGGRIRIYELYRHMAQLDFDITYVGAYDWPGPVYRDQMLAPRFRECVTPLTQPHFAHNNRYVRATGGKTTIDVTIHQLMKYTPRFARMAAEYGKDAEVVIVSHPWVYPYLSRQPQQKLIYDSHNCEYMVKQQILGDTRAGRKLVDEVKKLEGNLCRAADLVFTCSNDDAESFVKLYGVEREKMVVVPNGVAVEDIQPATSNERLLARQEFNLAAEQPALIFIGSAYGPNTQAAAFIVKQVAPRLPQCAFLIAGSVKESYEAAHGPQQQAGNVSWLGTIDNARRLALYHAADIALNPMFSGSGTNLKMLDYFAAGLPVISTVAGARGLDLAPDACLVCAPDEFAVRIEGLIGEPPARNRMGRNARNLAVERYAWGLIAATAADAILNLLRGEPTYVS